jgi:ABC-type nitrate/sulfonate/bicarbonate transport system permease component
MGTEDGLTVSVVDISADAIDVVVAPSTRRGRGALALRLAKGLLGTAVSIGVVIGAWWLFLEWFQVKPFIGKGPSDVWHYLFTAPNSARNRRLIFAETGTTLRDAFLGLGFGTAVAVLAAIAFNLWRSLERTLMPIAMVLRSVPLVAMTPLIVLVFGRDLQAVTIIASIVTFFPTLVNVTLALRATPQDSLDLLRAYGASPLHTLLKVKVPSALPSLFASMRIAAPLALVGALLAEFLATGKGLGYAILRGSTTSDFNGLWARVVIVTICSIVLYRIIGLVERVVLVRFAPAYGR